MEMRVDIEFDTFFAQGFHRGRHVRHAEAKDGVLVRSEIGH